MCTNPKLCPDMFTFSKNLFDGTFYSCAVLLKLFIIGILYSAVIILINLNKTVSQTFLGFLSFTYLEAYSKNSLSFDWRKLFFWTGYLA